MAEGAVEVNDGNFEQEVEGTPGLVLLDMGAEWCPPCKTLEPIIEALAGEMAGKVKVCTLDVGEGPQTAARFGVLNIPTMIFFKNGEEAERLIGFVPKAEIMKVIDRLTGS